MSSFLIFIVVIMSHPKYPQSNVSKFSDYNPDRYAVDDISPTVTTDESLTPCRPPVLTQRTVAKCLQPLTRELVEVPPRPTVDELPVAVIENMVNKDKAFWVDRPGANAYTLHNAYYNYDMTTERVLPPHQDVFPRSYQYDLDCVRYRRQNACNRLKKPENLKLPLEPHCRPCGPGVKLGNPAIVTNEATQKRWRYYPDLTATLKPEQIRVMMDEVGRPFKNEACNWYYQNYPSVKYNCIVRKFSQ